ncbi:hypothetical protein L1987_53720 [Smallanthus sonchifolius]|uniref:Uncharacterized protein n=1 Tax=Smallanthus sonchifolius TaxID=185202 RepID=A0ACB9EX35_9ASTR|nr:hypothetical protein L1987_53720 [Smallanthus sonchifolius]
MQQPQFQQTQKHVEESPSKSKATKKKKKGKMETGNDEQPSKRKRENGTPQSSLFFRFHPPASCSSL